MQRVAHQRLEQAHFHEHCLGPLSILKYGFRDLERRPFTVAGIAMTDARLLVKPEGIARLARDARAGKIMAFTSRQVKAEATCQLDADLAFEVDGDRHFRASHSARRGHPAVTQSRSSSTRHNVERPMRTGRGIQPAASHVRQVRRDLPQIDAASRALSSNAPDQASFAVLFSTKHPFVRRSSASGKRANDRVAVKAIALAYFQVR
jgi:hypothetical protein